MRRCPYTSRDCSPGARSTCAPPHRNSSNQQGTGRRRERCHHGRTPRREVDGPRTPRPRHQWQCRPEAVRAASASETASIIAPAPAPALAARLLELCDYPNAVHPHLRRTIHYEPPIVPQPPHMQPGFLGEGLHSVRGEEERGRAVAARVPLAAVTRCRRAGSAAAPVSCAADLAIAADRFRPQSGEAAQL